MRPVHKDVAGEDCTEENDDSERLLHGVNVSGDRYT